MNEILNAAQTFVTSLKVEANNPSSEQAVEHAKAVVKQLGGLERLLLIAAIYAVAKDTEGDEESMTIPFIEE